MAEPASPTVTTISPMAEDEAQDVAPESPTGLSAKASLLPVVHSGQFVKKNDKLDAARRATHRNWKPFFVELRGSQLLFYADEPEPDEEDEGESGAAAAGTAESGAGAEETLSRKMSKVNKEQLKKAKAEEKKRQERDARRRATHKRARSEIKQGDFDEMNDKEMEQKLTEALCVGIISTENGHIEVDETYSKEKRHVLRLITKKLAEYLFEFQDDKSMQEWIIHIRACAGEKAPEIGSSREPELERKNGSKSGTLEKPDKSDRNISAATSSANTAVNPSPDKSATVKPDMKAEKKERERREKEEKERREKEEKERKEKDKEEKERREKEEKERKEKDKEEKERREKEEKERKEREKQERKTMQKASPKDDSPEAGDKKDKDKEKRGFFGAKRKQSSETAKSGTLGKDQKKAFFGVPLSEQIFSDLNVPLLVNKCIEKIDESGLTSVGLYRLAGSNATNQTLRNLFDTAPEKIDFSESSLFDDDMNVIADCLKTYFRELPEPLMTFELYDEFVSAGKHMDYDARMLRIQELVHHLPEPNFNTLLYLSGHLARVAANNEINKMAASNLAIVFGPNLLRPKVESIQSMMHDMPYKCTVIEALIQQPIWIFQEPAEHDDEGEHDADGPGNDFEYDNLEQYNSRHEHSETETHASTEVACSQEGDASATPGSATTEDYADGSAVTSAETVEHSSAADDAVPSYDTSEPASADAAGAD